MVYSADAANYTLGIDDEIARICFPGTLTPLKTKGAIILCDVLYDGSVALDGEAVGVIMPSSFEDLAFAFPVPVAVISYEDHDLVLDYIKSAE